MVSLSTPTDQQALLVEYQKAQDSAEHHDKLVWTVSSIVLSGMLALLGLIFDNLNKPNLMLLNSFVATIGIFLCIFLILFQSSFKSIKKQKYRRCRVIERILGMRQHINLEHNSNCQTYWYWFIIGLFIAMWSLVLLHVLNV